MLSVASVAPARPRCCPDLLPLSSVQAWSEARRLVLTEADDLALYLWPSAKNELRTLLSESYA